MTEYSAHDWAPRDSEVENKAVKHRVWIDFEDAAGRHVLSADADPTDRLIDVCDTCRTPVEFSCRSGTCGTCRIEVREGAEFLEAPRADELETLEAFDAPPSHRLACRARLRGIKGRLRLRWAGNDP